MNVNRLLPWSLLLFLFGAFAATAGWLLWTRAEAGREMPRYSVYSDDADGLAEAARFLQKLGWEPVALTRPVAQLRPGTAPQLLIMVEPHAAGRMPGREVDLGAAQTRSLLRWVEAGNTLLLCGRHATSLHGDLDVVLTTDVGAADDDAVREAVPGEAGAYTDGVEQLQVEGRDDMQGPRGLPLWWLDDRPGALLLRRGRGRVLLVADPSLLTRRGLSRADNAVFLYNVARLHGRDGRIYFDEYHHGLRSGGGFWGYLSYHRQHWLLAPVFFAVVVGIWSVAVRLGPAVAPPPLSQTDAVDYASALARIYERAGVRHLLAATLVRNFQAALTRHLRLRRSALPAEILAAWSKRPSGDAAPGAAQRLAVLLRGAAELRQGTPSESRLLYWTREFDRFSKEFLSV